MDFVALHPFNAKRGKYVCYSYIITTLCVIASSQTLTKRVSRNIFVTLTFLTLRPDRLILSAVGVLVSLTVLCGINICIGSASCFTSLAVQMKERVGKTPSPSALCFKAPWLP